MSVSDKSTEAWDRNMILLDKLSPRIHDRYLGASFTPSCERIRMILGEMKEMVDELPSASWDAFGPHRRETVEQVKVTLASLGEILDKLREAKRKTVEAGGVA